MAMPCQIRPATQADLAAINAIYNFYVRTSTATFDLAPWTIRQRRAWFRRHGERYPVLVAEQDGQIVGWCSISPYRARAGYRFTGENSVYVRDDRRGRGIGSLLLGALLQEARRLDYRVVVARIGGMENQASIALHERLGFRHVGIEHEVGRKFDRWLDVVEMQWLNPAVQGSAPISGGTED